MKLWIDDREIHAKAGLTLLDLVRSWGWIPRCSPNVPSLQKSPVKPLR